MGRAGRSGAAPFHTHIHRKEAGEMSLSTWNRNPFFDDFARARDDMDRMLGRFLGSTMTTPESRLTRGEGWLPPVDVSENDEEVMVRTEVPGIAARDIDVTIAGSTLNISGRKDEKEECEQEDFYRCERRFGSFRRVVDLPDSVDPDRVTAEADNGVITIRIAKKPGQRTRRVEVKSETRAPARRIPVPG
jgi:HSP20 family protein